MSCQTPCAAIAPRNPENPLPLDQLGTDNSPVKILPLLLLLLLLPLLIYWWETFAVKV